MGIQSKNVKKIKNRVTGNTTSTSALISTVADANGYTRQAVADIVKMAFAEIQKELASGNAVALNGIGKISVVFKDEHEARNPATGGTVTVPAGHKVKFKASSTLNELVK